MFLTCHMKHKTLNKTTCKTPTDIHRKLCVHQLKIFPTDGIIFSGFQVFLIYLAKYVWYFSIAISGCLKCSFSSSGSFGFCQTFDSCLLKRFILIVHEWLNIIWQSLSAKKQFLSLNFLEVNNRGTCSY